MNGLYFRAFSNVLVYNAVQKNDDNKLTNHLYGYETETMRNVELHDNASTTNQYCVSEEYAYFDNVINKNDKIYYNHKQIKLSDGSIKVFGEETEGNTPYYLVGAIGGYLFATDNERTITYVCREDTPGNFTKFWDKPISYLWAGSNDLFFKSRDPADDTPKSEAKYYFYHTDYEGNIISKQELVGGMKWGSIYDGKNLYYIPSKDETFICGDGTEKSIHCREIYCLNMETGERTVAFKFDGMYETMALQLGLGNEMIVLNNKIYTYSVGEINSKENIVTKEVIVYGKGVSLRNGIIIIDMSNGDITFVQAEYSRNTDKSCEAIYNIEKIEMDLAREE